MDNNSFKNVSHLKNIFMVGPARSGKTSAASLLDSKYGYTHEIMDVLIETIYSWNPELGINHDTLDSSQFKSLLAAFTKRAFRYNYVKPYVIDLDYVDPDFLETLVDNDESIIVYMGYPSISPEEKLRQIRENDTEYDWSRRLPDSTLLDIVTKHIKTSKYLQEKAIQHNRIFIDTSFDRESVIDTVLDKLMKSEQIHRSDKSYEKIVIPPHQDALDAIDH